MKWCSISYPCLLLTMGVFSCYGNTIINIQLTPFLINSEVISPSHKVLGSYLFGRAGYVDCQFRFLSYVCGLNCKPRYAVWSFSVKTGWTPFYPQRLFVGSSSVQVALDRLCCFLCLSLGLLVHIFLIILKLFLYFSLLWVILFTPLTSKGHAWKK